MKYTLIQILEQLFPNSSKNTLKQWIKEERISVEGELCTDPKREVDSSQKVTLGQRTRHLEGHIRIVYEDRDFVAIDKPAGLLSVATAFEKKTTAYAILNDHFHPKKVYVVHRLDQETSGIMLFALSKRGQEASKLLFEKHDIQRIYYALIEGHLPQEQGTWRSYQYEDALYYVHTTQDPQAGKLAITHYQVKAKQKHASLLELTLETGRKNQIRVHCQNAGHSIIGDKKYGSKIRSKRLCLHAQFLSFIHPFTQERISLRSEVPFAEVYF